MKELTIEAMMRQRDEWHNTAEARWNALADKSEQVNQLRRSLDELLAEAVWAMEYVEALTLEPEYQRAQAFLTSPLVAAWRKRQKGIETKTGERHEGEA